MQTYTAEQPSAPLASCSLCGHNLATRRASSESGNAFRSTSAVPSVFSAVNDTRYTAALTREANFCRTFFTFGATVNMQYG